MPNVNSGIFPFADDVELMFEMHVFASTCYVVIVGCFFLFFINWKNTIVYFFFHAVYLYFISF